VALGRGHGEAVRDPGGLRVGGSRPRVQPGRSDPGLRRRGRHHPPVGLRGPAAPPEGAEGAGHPARARPPRDRPGLPGRRQGPGLPGGRPGRPPVGRGHRQNARAPERAGVLVPGPPPRRQGSRPRRQGPARRPRQEGGAAGGRGQRPGSGRAQARGGRLPRRGLQPGRLPPGRGGQGRGGRDALGRGQRQAEDHARGEGSPPGRRADQLVRLRGVQPRR
jgi:hypothetical protein